MSSMLHLKERHYRPVLPRQWRVLLGKERTQFDCIFVWEWRGIEPFIKLNQEVFGRESGILADVFNGVECLRHCVLHRASIISFCLFCKSGDVFRKPLFDFEIWDGLAIHSVNAGNEFPL